MSWLTSVFPRFAPVARLISTSCDWFIALSERVADWLDVASLEDEAQFFMSKDVASLEDEAQFYMSKPSFS